MKSLHSMTGDEIRTAVLSRYNDVARSPGASFGFPVGSEFAGKLGYPQDLLERWPDSVSESFTGAGNPHGFVDPAAGETLLDLGCGAGLDLCLYARSITESGRVIGVDHSPEMIDKAGQSARLIGIGWAEFICSGVESIGLPEGSVDVITANGILNLSPDKDAVLEEVCRLLKPGGRMVFAEIVLTESVDGIERESIDDWFRCIGGAENLDSLLTRMRRCGFETTETQSLTRNARTGHEHSRSAVISARTRST